MTTYIEYLDSFKQIEKLLNRKLLGMYYKISNNDLPYNYILYKCLELTNNDNSFVPKIKNADLVNHYDNLWRKITWNNDWVYGSSPAFVRTRIKKLDRREIYLINYEKLINESNIPQLTKEELLEWFPNVWNIYIAHFSDSKFIPPEFMIRKLLQNIGHSQYLTSFPRLINNVGVLQQFENLWKNICNKMNITYY
jgi:hypothetical protein